MEKMRVLLLAIFPRVEQRIKALLNSIPEVEIIPTDANNAEAAMDVIFKEKPDVVMLENDFPGQDGFYLTGLIRREQAATQVIILSEISSAEAVRQAMRAGACDYISYKTVALEELIAALEHAQSLSREERAKRRFSSDEGRIAVKKAEKRQRARIVTFYSPKGGAGVSTIVANLAYVYHKRKQKVLVIDGDLQYGDISILYNQNATHTLADITERVSALDNEMIEKILVQAGPDILPAPAEPEQAVQFTGQGFTKIIKYAAMMNYDIVLVNTSSYITDPCFAALEVADIIMLVTLQEISAVRSARSFLTLMDKVDIGKSKVDLIINRFDIDSSLTPQRIGESLGHKVSKMIPPDAATALRAANLGIPFTAQYTDLPICRALADLADHINMLLGKLEPLPVEEVKEQSA